MFGVHPAPFPGYGKNGNYLPELLEYGERND
jgi:hypothetical protein